MPDSLYNIPSSSPPVALSFNGAYTPQLNPSIVLLSMIENMQPICRHVTTTFPPFRVFDYALVRITIRNLYLPSCGPLTYNDVCTVLRGLAEFMVLQNRYAQWRFHIWVNGFALGSGQVDGIHRVLPAASAAGVASS